ncbi:MAG: hypothetical protein IPG45_11655 [Deltaproteobacteria bacterium]|nr:hypothetical protein [Deltaproteobacteria bacterium]
MRSWIPLLWLGVVACGAEDQELYWGWPTLDDRIQSVILALRSDRAPIGDTERTLLKARAVTEARTGKVSLRFDEEPDLRLHLLAYELDLASMGLVPGRLPRPEGEANPRPLPRPVELHRHVGDGTWIPEDVLDAELSEVRLPAPDPFACLEAGGCALSGDEVCRRPCGPPASPRPPEAPTPPAAPSIDGLGCGEATNTITLADRTLGVCAAPMAAFACGVAEIHPPDLPACVPVGPACPARWAAPPSGGSVLYVDDDAPAGGDGTAATPYSTINEAIAAATDGTTVLVARGRYTEELVITQAITLLGACAADTVLAVAGGVGLFVRGAVEVVGLRVEGGAPGILLGEPTAELSLSEVVIQGGDVGLQIPLGRVIAEALLVRGTNLDGIAVSAGARLELRSSYIEETGGPALSVVTGAQLIADQLVVRRPRRSSDRGGEGLTLYASGTAQLSRSYLEGTQSVALWVQGASTSLALSDVILRDPEGPLGSGLVVGDGARVTGGRLRIERAPVEALAISGGAQVELEDLTVVGTGFGDTRIPPPLAGTSNDAHLRLTRVTLRDSQGHGLAVDGASAEVSDLIIDRVAGAPGNYGVIVNSGMLQVERGVLSNVGSTALYLTGTEPVVFVDDLLVTDAGLSAVFLSGFGDRLVGARLDLGPTGGSTFVATGGTSVEVEDLRVHGAKESSGRRAGALVLKDESGALIDRFVVEDCLVSGLDVGNTRDSSRAKRLKNGLVRRNVAGMVWRADAEQVPAILDNVSFADNELLLGNSE